MKSYEEYKENVEHWGWREIPIPSTRDLGGTYWAKQVNLSLAEIIKQLKSTQGLATLIFNKQNEVE